MKKQVPYLRIILAFLLVYIAGSLRCVAQCTGYTGPDEANFSIPSFATTGSNVMALDASGTPYVAFEDGNNGQKATVKKYNGTSWVTVGSPGFSAGVATSLAIAIDNNSGIIYVAFQDNSTLSTKKATVMMYNGTSWVMVGGTAVSNGAAGSLSLALSGTGTPYLAYSDNAAGAKATVMSYNGTAWALVGGAVVTNSNSTYVSLAIDGSNIPYVAFKDNGNGGRATVKKCTGTGWTTLGSVGFTSSGATYTSLAVSSSGTPYVIFEDAGNSQKATVMQYNGSGWVTVGSAGFSSGQVQYNTILINNGTLYVAFQDVANGNRATVMKYNGSSWVTIGYTGFSYSTAANLSIAVNSSGTVYASYQDNGIQAMVMQFDGTTWTTTGLIGVSAGLVNYTATAVDKNGTPYIAYADYGNNGKITVMKYNGSSWVRVGTSGFSAGSVLYVSIAIDQSGTPYVAYSDLANAQKVTVMKYNGSTWVAVGGPSLSPATGFYTSIAIDASGVPYVAYMDDANGDKATVMKYTGAWNPVGSVGFSLHTATYTSLAIDGGGNPYLAFQDSYGGATVMKYNGSGWVLVGAEGFSAGTATYTSLAIDGSGTPYVAYSDAANAGKATAQKFNGSSWVSIGNGFSAGAATYTSIAIDPSGSPYVAYSDASMNSKPVLMRFNGSYFYTIGTTDTVVYGVAYPAIAAAPDGSVYMVHTDGGAWVQQFRFPVVSKAQAVCGSGTVADLSAQAPGNINWYDAGGNPLVATTALSAGIYYASYTDGLTGCESARAPTIVTINAAPAAPTATASQAFCGSIAKIGNLAAAITAGNSLKWYAATSGTPALADTVTLISGNTYYATQTNGNGCESVQKAVAVTVNPTTVTPPAVTTSAIYYAQGATAASLTGNATGTALKWYTQALGGTGSGTVPTVATTNVGDKSYWVTQTVGGCESARSQIDILTFSASQNYLNFDGADDRVVVAANAKLPLGNTARTMEAWIKTTTPTHLMAIMNYGNYVHNNRFGLLVNPSGYLYFVGETNDYVATTGQVADGQCHHVAVTYDGTTVLLYVDGVQVGSTTKALATAGNQFSIGTSWRAQWDEFFKGDIDEVRIWNTARTQQQLQNYMTADLAGNEPGLVAYYKFSSGIGGGTNTTVTTATDGTTYGNNATLTNFALTGATSNWETGTNTAPVGNDVTYCLNQQAAALTGTGSNLKWYTAPVGGLGTGTAPTPATNTAGTAYYYLTQATGCRESARDTLIVTTAAISNPPLAITSKVQTLAVSGTTTFSNGCADLISTITPTGAAPLAGNTTAKVYIQSTAPAYNAAPYVRRYYDVTPATGASTATANITIYFTQADFDDYNANRGTFLSLPVNTTDAANNKANLRIRQQHGTSATGLPGSYSGWAGTGPANLTITPTTVSYNSTASRWEVTLPVTGFSGFFAQTNAPAPPPNSFFVDGTATGAGTGSTWTDAYTRLSDALASINLLPDTAVYTLYLSAGTYYPGTNRDSAFVITHGGIKILGGYPHGGGARNITANPTILSGDIGVAGDSTDNSYHVLVIAGTPATTDSIVVDGVTIRNGNANGTGTDTYNGTAIDQTNGGGIVTANNAGTPIALRNLSFLSNHTGQWGAAIYNNSAIPIIDSCTFSYNTSGDDGGAIYVTGGSTASINHSTFSYNSAPDAGGAIYINGPVTILNSAFTHNNGGFGGAIHHDPGAATTMANCFFAYNNASLSGGAMSTYQSTISLGNCVLANNTTPNNSGAIGMYGGAITLTGCTVANNTAPNQAINTFGNLTITNSIIFGNSSAGLTSGATVTNSLLQDAGYSGTGIITADPSFTNAALPAGADGLWGTADDGLTLRSCSPAINAGTTPAPAMPADCLGNARVGVYDIGAYEYQSASTLPTIATAAATYTTIQAATVMYGYCDNLITTVTSTGASAVGGNVTAKVYVPGSAATYNGMPYVGRHYDILPDNNASAATATITLYFLQADFDSYNLIRGSYPSLPINTADAAGYKANLLISQEHGASASGNPGTYTGFTGNGPANVLITPTQVAYNATLARWEVTFPVTGFSGFFASSGLNTPLAVTLADVAATNEGRKNSIDWTTQTEQPGDYFEVQRSLNGNSFQPIGTTPATHPQGGSYTLIDEAPATGINYYRIRTVSTNGNIQYSKTVSATVAQGSFVLQAYPNPTGGVLNIRIGGAAGSNATISILDATGMEVSRQAVTGTEATLSLSELAAGIYLLEYRDDNRVQHLKVQKQ